MTDIICQVLRTFYLPISWSHRYLALVAGNWCQWYRQCHLYYSRSPVFWSLGSTQDRYQWRYWYGKLYVDCWCAFERYARSIRWSNDIVIYICLHSVSLHWEWRQQHTSTICCSRHDVCKFESKDVCLFISSNQVWSQIFSASFASAWGPIGWVYPAEIFPMRARAKGTSCMLMIPAIYHRYDN